MKNLKKIFALALALMMVLSLATTAFAADGDTYTITINNTATGHTYEAYQIFKGTLSGAATNDNIDGTSAVLSDIQWGSGVTNTDKISFTYKDDENKDVTVTTAADIAEALADKKVSVDDFQAVISKNLSTTHTDSKYADGKYTISGLEAGYYLIKDKDNSVTGHDAYTEFIMEVVEDSTVTAKADVPTVEKKILDPDEVDVNEAAIGEEVKYQITGTLPDNITSYKEYYYCFTDTLSKGLTYKADSMVIKVNNVDVTKYFYKEIGTYNETTGTTITVAIADLLALENLTNPTVGTITKATEIVITYTATLNENAVINGFNPNDVKLDYSNNPEDSGEGTPDNPPENPDKPTPEHPTGETPKDTVETFVTEVHIEKVDEEGKALVGAEFQISGTALKTVIVYTDKFTVDNENGTYWKLTDGTYTTTAPTIAEDETDNSADYADVNTKYTKTTEKKVITTSDNVAYKAFVGEDGKLTFTGLAEGEYTITEITTPAGYNTIADITLKVTFDETNKTFTYEWSGGATGNTNTIKVVNQAGSTLPETGGMGTTMFYIVGSLMVLAAVVLLVTKKRMASAE